MPPTTRRLAVTLPSSEIERLDALVTAGEFATRSDAARQLLHDGHRYREALARIAHANRGVALPQSEASEILPGLHVGPQVEAPVFHDAGWFVLNVLERAPATPHDLWLPILTERDEWGDPCASVPALDQVAETIDGALLAGRPVFVHCGQGIERSPLALAWFLWTRRDFASFEAAYATVCARHRSTLRRDAWIPWTARHTEGPDSAHR